MRRTQRTGFTLIELLVVIAIIAILAAILFPVFAQAREKARSATCLSNCKQLGNALRMYLDDYEGAYPLSWFSAGQYGFDVAIYPYVKNKQVYACPSNPLPISDWPGYYRLGVGPIPRSYCMNGDVSTDLRTTPTLETSIVDAASTIMMLETSDTYNGRRGPDHETYTRNRNEVCVHVPFRIHQGGSNYVFADTHARWARVEQTWRWWRPDQSEMPPPENLCTQKRQGA